jgi:xanthine dehydrogenase YagT iron-sulfur-binding subunit
MSGDSGRKKKDGESEGNPGISRRDFLTTAGIGAVGVAAVHGAASAPPVVDAGVSRAIGASDAVKVTLTINGRDHRLLVEPRWSLLHALREKLGLTGTKVGCDRGECGACTVLIDGKPRYACLTLVLEAEGTEITTLEGLLDGEKLGAVQQAFLEQDAFQCGYCTPGQIVAVEGLLRASPNPSLDEIRLGVSGNLCRCGAYPNIFRAAKRAAELKGAKGGRS